MSLSLICKLIDYRVLRSLMDRLDQGYCLDGSSCIGDEEGSELEYAENDEYVTPPEEGRLVPVEEPLPPAELVIYAPDNEGDLDIKCFESVRDGELDCQVRHCPV